MKLTQRDINKINRILDNYVFPLLVAACTIGVFIMAIEMLISCTSEHGEIARMQRQESMRNFPITERDYRVE